MIFDKPASLTDLKEDTHVLSHIIWDIEPKQIMDPMYIKTPEGKTHKRIIRGYIFYIETVATEKPCLLLLCHTSSGYAETVAKIDEIPTDLLIEAIQENKEREYFGMYPINNKIITWLKKELGLAES